MKTALATGIQLNYTLSTLIKRDDFQRSTVAKGFSALKRGELRDLKRKRLFEKIAEKNCFF